jgi:curved DNA-binding protein CbpA
MTKDYYKILGVKEDASEEEIRTRWIELTKRHHPDRRKDKASGERIKDINEAYQLLKHSSTRVEYDLRRTYDQKKRKGKKRSFFKRYGIPVSLLIILIILSILYFKNSQIPLHSKLISLNDIKHINLSNPIDPMTQKLSDTRNPTKPTSPMDSSDLLLQVAQFKPPSPLATEDDVRKFFANYIERYNRMDLEGFLSLFFSKAIQNQKDRIEGIRKIYTDFFNQGQEVRCQIQDMKIEIYQNAVEVKARYQIEQISKKSEGRIVSKGQIQWVLIKENGAFKIVSLDYQHD